MRAAHDVFTLPDGRRVKGVVEPDFVPMDVVGRRTRHLRCLTWAGAPPRAGDFIRCKGPLARRAYRVLEHTLRWSTERLWHGGITVEVYAVGDVPDDATVHFWTWAARRRKSASRSPLL